MNEKSDDQDRSKRGKRDSKFPTNGKERQFPKKRPRNRATFVAIFEAVRSLTGIISLVGDPPGRVYLLSVEFLGPSLYWLMRQDVVCDPVAT